jgi:hypothetical protein
MRLRAWTFKLEEILIPVLPLVDFPTASRWFGFPGLGFYYLKNKSNGIYKILLRNKLEHKEIQHKVIKFLSVLNILMQCFLLVDIEYMQVFYVK